MPETWAEADGIYKLPSLSDKHGGSAGRRQKMALSTKLSRRHVFLGLRASLNALQSFEPQFSKQGGKTTCPLLAGLGDSVWRISSSLHSRCKRGKGRGARTREKNEGAFLPRSRSPSPSLFTPARQVRSVPARLIINAGIDNKRIRLASDAHAVSGVLRWSTPFHL